MAIPGQPMMPPSPAGPVPGAMPQPGAPPAGGMAGNPLAALAGAAGGGGGMPQGMMQFLTFLAGVGFKHFEETINKLRNPQGKGGGHGGKTALGKEAAGNPQQTQLGAQMLAQLAARRNAAIGGGAAGQPNPMAALIGRA